VPCVIKRSGKEQPIDKAKIKRRYLCHSQGLNEEYINYDVIVEKVYSGIYHGESKKRIPPFSFYSIPILTIL